MGPKGHRRWRLLLIFSWGCFVGLRWGCELLSVEGTAATQCADNDRTGLGCWHDGVGCDQFAEGRDLIAQGDVGAGYPRADTWFAGADGSGISHAYGGAGMALGDLQQLLVGEQADISGIGLALEACDGFGEGAGMVADAICSGDIALHGFETAATPLLHPGGGKCLAAHGIDGLGPKGHETIHIVEVAKINSAHPIKGDGDRGGHLAFPIFAPSAIATIANALSHSAASLANCGRHGNHIAVCSKIVLAKKALFDEGVSAKIAAFCKRLAFDDIDTKFESEAF